MASRDTPPYRADHVGSLLRPPALLQAREDFANDKIDADELRGVEDDAIRDAVKLQEDVGLRSATDGEFRRATWHMDFIYSLGGVSKTPGQLKVKFHNAEGDIEWTPAAMHVDSQGHAGEADLRRALRVPAGVRHARPRRSSRSRSREHGPLPRRAGGDRASPSTRTWTQFWDDLTTAYADQVRAMRDLGCTLPAVRRHVSLAYLNDPNQRAEMAAKGDDAEHLHETYIRHINEALTERPEGMAITTHMCRGNFRSSWVAEGGYDFVAEALFNELDVDGFFMEWDDARSGGFEPLRFVPKGKVVVLGLVTTKTGDLETKDLLKRRIEEAIPVRRPRPALPLAAVRLLLDRRGQRADASSRRSTSSGSSSRPRKKSGARCSRAARHCSSGVVAAALGVALTTLLVFALRDVAPVRLARRRLPRDGAGHRLGLGRLARARDRAG